MFLQTCTDIVRSLCSVCHTFEDLLVTAKAMNIIMEDRQKL